MTTRIGPFVATAAQADGVLALYTVPVTTLSAADKAMLVELAKEPGFASVTPVRPNLRAIDSNVTPEGKEYRFVGKQQDRHMVLNSGVWELSIESWVGDAGPGTFAVFTFAIFLRN